MVREYDRVIAAKKKKMPLLTAFLLCAEMRSGCFPQTQCAHCAQWESGVFCSCAANGVRCINGILFVLGSHAWRASQSGLDWTLVHLSLVQVQHQLRGHVSARASVEVILALRSHALVVEYTQIVVAAVIQASAVQRFDSCQGSKSR